MKIKQIEYKKLFNLGNFEHEEIGISVEPEIKHGSLENQDAVISDTIDKVENIHRSTQILQKMKDRIDTIYANWEDNFYLTSMPHDSITHHEDEIKKAECKIEEYSKLQKEKISKEDKNYSKAQIDRLKQRIKEHEEKLAELQKEGAELLEKYQSLKSDFKKGELIQWGKKR